MTKRKDFDPTRLEKIKKKSNGIQTEKLQRSGVRLSERLSFFRSHGDQIVGPLVALRTSQHYCIEGFKKGPQFHPLSQTAYIIFSRPYIYIYLCILCIYIINENNIR